MELVERVFERQKDKLAEGRQKDKLRAYIMLRDKKTSSQRLNARVHYVKRQKDKLW